jgi:two-component system, sensor histidine kinase and response regulator
MKKGTIMIVDDVESEIDILVDILHKDYEVCVAMDGQSALETADEALPDLILLDIVMPGINGYQVCRRLKANSRTRDIPVIFVTVLSEEGHETTGLELGALDYITKPFNREIVLARVRNHMDLIEALRLKEDVSRIISHDMRNELSTIIGFPDMMLQDKSLAPQNRKMLEKIRNSGYKLLNMINLGLQLHKMERGQYCFEPVRVDVMTVINGVLEHKEGLSRSKSIDVRLTRSGLPIEDGGRFTVLGEDFLLYSMFSNLIINALEASPRGGTVTIDLRKNGEAMISIHNAGAVPEEIRDRFFGKYATAGKVLGTGLGAYSALLMARTLGGTVDMITSQEDGTTLTVRLPH